jgi:hypothetical protein
MRGSTRVFVEVRRERDTRADSEDLGLVFTRVPTTEGLLIYSDNQCRYPVPYGLDIEKEV